MRLINAKTLRIEEFPSEDAYPPYAILSHTWGTPEQECTLQSMIDPDVSSRVGYTKIKLCCDQALKDGLSWAWVDTCCIDKTSTAELSEAINSMFRWYQKASICYAFIEDANTVDDLQKSRWFTRGWTLQELVAPHDVVFFSKLWCQLGRKLELKDVLWKITGIEPAVLESGILSNVTVAKKMSWAAKRKTTRVEDLAYCLLGIFDVYMPMLYGEGKRSFIRLQEEIMKSSYDHTLFAWSQCPPTRTAEDFIKEEAESSAPSSIPKPSILCGLLAESPTMFSHSNDVLPVEDNFQSGNDITSGGGRIVIQLPAFQKGTQLFAALPCIAGNSYLALPLDRWRPNFVARRAEMVLVQADDLYTQSGELATQRFQVKKPIEEPAHALPPTPNVSYIAMITCQNHALYHAREVHCSPHATYDEITGKLTLTRGHTGLHAACLFQPVHAARLQRPTNDRVRAMIGYFWKAAVLIGGDLTGDGKLWVAIVPLLPDTGADEAFHDMCTQNPAITTHCTTRRMLLDQLASGSDMSVFSKIGHQQVKNWQIGRDHWTEKQFKPELGLDRAYERVYVERVIFISAKVDVLHAHPAEKAFKITITFEERGNGASKNS